MRVFQWNMTPPSTSPTSQRQKWCVGFACEGAAAYMGLTWRATNSLTICSKLRARKSGEIEMRLVRRSRNDRNCRGLTVRPVALRSAMNLGSRNSSAKLFRLAVSVRVSQIRHKLTMTFRWSESEMALRRQRGREECASQQRKIGEGHVELSRLKRSFCSSP